MNERLKPISFRFDAQVAGAGVAGAYVPEAFLLTHVSVFGSITNAEYDSVLDIQDDGVTAVSNVDLETDQLNELATPVRFAKDSLIELDMTFTDAAATFTGEIVLWGHFSE